jgi:hypothetical protein
MTSNWKISELEAMAILPDAAYVTPCPACRKKGLNYDCDCQRVICQACGYEVKVI